MSGALLDLLWLTSLSAVRLCQVLAALTSGSLVLFDTATAQVKAQLSGTAELVGVDLFSPQPKAPISSSTIVTCTAAGALTLTPVSQLLSSPPSTPTPPPPPAYTLGSNLTRMRVCPFPSTPLLASGGREQLLRLHDLTTGQLTFKAKNLPHSHLNLRLPVHLTDLRFLHSSPSLLVEGTATKQLRFYDTRAKKQPTSWMEVGEHAVSALAVTGDDALVMVGDVAGEVRAVDRRMGRVVGGYHGIGGSVRSVELDADSATLAGGSLDRHLRLYDVRSRRLLRKVYVKQKVNCCLWSRRLLENTKVKKEGEEEEVGDEDDEGMWRELAERRRSAMKKRRGDGGVKEEEKEGNAAVVEQGKEDEEEDEASSGTAAKEQGKRRRLGERGEAAGEEKGKENEVEEEDEEGAEGEEEEEEDEGTEAEGGDVEGDEQVDSDGGEEVDERESPESAPRRSTPAKAQAGSRRQ